MITKYFYSNYDKTIFLSFILDSDFEEETLRDELAKDILEETICNVDSFYCDDVVELNGEVNAC